MSEYVTKDGDHVTAKGLTLTVEFGERTKNEIMAKVEEVRDENAMLRELVRDMFEEIEAAGFDQLVERQGKRGTYYEEDPSWRVKIRERVREMGIEVDDG